MAVDAKGQDFVIVSHVNGHAKEVHVGLRQATRTEAEVNNEADKRTVRAAREHAMTEMVMKNKKNQGATDEDHAAHAY